MTTKEKKIDRILFILNLIEETEKKCKHTEIWEHELELYESLLQSSHHFFTDLKSMDKSKSGILALADERGKKRVEELAQKYNSFLDEFVGNA